MKNAIRDFDDLHNRVYMLRCLCNVVASAVSDYDPEKMEQTIDTAAGNLMIMQELIEQIDDAMEDRNMLLGEQ